MNKESKREKIEYELRGKTLQVYLYMLSKGEPIGVREIQRSLRFSSPSVAYHHINKLESLGIVKKDEYGRYILVENVDIGVLQAFIKIGKFTLPRLSFYATFFTTLFIIYLIQYLNSANLHALSFSFVSAIAFWYEAIRVWRKKPF